MAHSFEEDFEFAKILADKVRSLGGTAYFVGGFVRDKILGISNKDIDIEIHGLRPSELETVLDSLGERVDMGESFGIYGIKGYSVDIAMPRKENCRGTGHRDFDVFVDPFIGTEGAAKRRDFTINALMENVLTGEIIDHFGGLSDLKEGIIRHVNDDSFGEDPLRVLRGAQFASRFNFKIADETSEICRNMRLDTLAPERVMGELSKALLKADRPSLFFETLKEMNQLDFWFPEVKILMNIEQNPKYHAEGNVWVHTMMVLDNAAYYLKQGVICEPLPFMMSALCHDFGKAVSTEIINGEIHSYEHELTGLPIVLKFLNRLTNEKKLLSYVRNMTLLHMRPVTLAKNKSKIKKTNALFDESVCPSDLIYLSVSDHNGRILNNGEEEADYLQFLLERLDIFNEYMSRPYVTGRDLMDAGLKPGKEFGKMLKFAHTLRLAGIPKKSALNQTLKQKF